MHGQHVAKLQNARAVCNNNARADAFTILKMAIWCKTDTERCIRNSLLRKLANSALKRVYERNVLSPD